MKTFIASSLSLSDINAGVEISAAGYRMNLAFGMPGPSELILILLVVLLLFGAAKLPGLARALGKSVGEFKKGRQEGDDNLKESSPSQEQQTGSPVEPAEKK